MAEFRLFAILFLLFAFGVLLWTFVWVARLLAARSQAGAGKSEPEPLPPDEPLPTPAEEAAEELEQTRKGTGVNATLGLILSALACLLFWLSPLVLVLSLAGVWFSGQSLWLGFRLFHIFIGRAGIGVALGLSSFGLQFGFQTGLFILPF